MHTTKEFQLFDAFVSLHGVWFSPTQDPDFEAMAACLLGKADGKTNFYEHLEKNYKKSTGKRRESEDIKGRKFRRRFKH